MLRRWDGQERVTPQRLVIDEGLMIASDHQVTRLPFESQRPIVWVYRLPTPSVGVQVVHDVATTYDENTFIAQRLQLSTNCVVKVATLAFIDAHLHNRNVGAREH